MQNLLNMINRIDMHIQNIQPEMIATGYNIFGIEGSAMIGGDTSDATASASDIREGYTAYAQNSKITGTLNIMNEVKNITSDATAIPGDIAAGKTAYVNGQKINGTLTPEFEHNPNSSSGLNGIQRFIGSFNTMPNINTTGIHDMSNMFNDAGNLQDISPFDTSSVTNTSNMFRNTYFRYKHNSQYGYIPANLYNASFANVINAECMFMNSKISNISPHWNFNNLAFANFMFEGSFVTNFENMTFPNLKEALFMFSNAYDLNIITNVSFPELLNCFQMLNNTSNLKVINGLHMPKVTSFSTGVPSVKSMLNLDLPNVNSMVVPISVEEISFINKFTPISLARMFQTCTKLTNISFENLDTSNATNACQIFASCNNLTNFPEFNYINCNNFSYAYTKCTNLINISNIKSGVANTDCTHMFDGCINLTDINNINISNIIKSSSMFYNTKIIELNETKIQLPNIHNAYALFTSMPLLSTVSNLNLGTATNVRYLYSNCPNLVNVSIININGATDIWGMFENCPNLSNNSLSNIMKTCINAINVTNKSLNRVFENYDYIHKCMNLPEYSDMINAGWNISDSAV